MYNEAVTRVRTLEIKDGFITAVELAKLKSQMNCTSLFFDLPNMIQAAEEEIEKGKIRLVAYKNSQEGGTV
jgi:hypothetical protein